MKNYFSGYTGLFMGLGISGLVLISWGTSSNNNILSVLGSGIFGACLSILISRMFDIDLKDELSNILKNSLNPGLISSEEKLKGLRKKWHHYHVSKVSKKNIWIYTELDFSSTEHVGKVLSKTTHNDHSYLWEGGMFSRRCILIGKPETGGEEPYAIEVYPDMGLGFIKEHHGVCFIQTWDEEHAINPCILSPAKLHLNDDNGVVSEKSGLDLDSKWAEGVNRHIMFPRIDHQQLKST